MLVNKHVSSHNTYIVATVHVCVVLRMHRLVRYMYDICVMLIRRNCVHGLLKLLVV